MIDFNLKAKKQESEDLTILSSQEIEDEIQKEELKEKHLIPYNSTRIFPRISLRLDFD